SIRFMCLKHSVGLQIYVIRFVPEFPTFHHQSPCGATLWLELREKDGGGVKLQTVKDIDYQLRSRSGFGFGYFVLVVSWWLLRGFRSGEDGRLVVFDEDEDEGLMYI
ncbi:hypothetical protein Tco_0777272, partial [Tanacetum coccineum]